MADEAPISAPAAPAAAPSAPAAPAAPAAEPIAAPAAPSAPQPTPSAGYDQFDEFPPDAPAPSGVEPMQPGESSASYLQRVQLAKIEAGKKTGDQPAAPPADAPKPGEGEKPNTKDAAPKPGEEAPKPAYDKSKDGQPQAGEDDDELTLTEPEILPTSELAKKINTPEVRAALEKAGVDVNSLFATARVAAKGQKVLEAFNGDVNAAITAKEQAEQFGELSEMFAGQNNVDDTTGLLRKMMEFSYVYDDDGKVQMVDRGDGTMIPKGDGTVGRFIDNVLQIGLQQWLKDAENSGNPDIKAACEVLQEEYQKLSGSAQPKDYSHLDQETRQRLEVADAREKELADREAADQTRQSQAFELNVATAIDTGIDDMTNRLLTNTTLTDGQKNWALEQIKERITDQLAHSKLFFNKRDSLMRRPSSDKTKQERIAHGLNSARPLLAKITNGVLAELGVSIETKASAASTKQDAQTAASRSEVRSASQVAKPAAPLSPADVNRMAVDELKASGIANPKTDQIFSKVFEIKKRLQG